MKKLGEYIPLVFWLFFYGLHSELPKVRKDYRKVENVIMSIVNSDLISQEYAWKQIAKKYNFNYEF